MKFVFQAVSVTDEKKPGAKQGYQKAVVIYTYNGEPRKQTIVSFSNPSIFKTVTQDLQPGDVIDVEVVKNANNFNEWKAVTKDGGTGPTPTYAANSEKVGTTKVVGSNYESREERASRQVLIVKQSSLAQAVESLGPNQEVDVYLERAQVFADWVFASAADTDE